ncbi:hypothetical protein BIV08_17125 [Pseudomonas sp. AF76]|nr:hypothetical protein BIV08_17125 [Pseudomonas sp. AF76]
MLRGQDPFYVFHNKDRWPKLANNSKVLLIEEVLLVTLKLLLALTGPSGATSDRVGLAWWTANENPLICTHQGFPDPAVDVLRRILTKLGELCFL